MSTIRRIKSKFTVIDNDLAQNENISFECVGMLTYLLSKPDNWECRVTDIERRGKFKKEKRRRIMIEAEKAGYLTFKRERKTDGKFTSCYTVHELPVEEVERTRSWTLNLKEEDEEETTGGKPADGLAGGRKTGDIQSTDLQSTELQKTEEKEVNFPAPSGGNLRSKIPDAQARVSLVATPALRLRPKPPAERPSLETETLPTNPLEIMASEIQWR